MMYRSVWHRRRLSAGFLLALFLGYVVSITAFTHSHVVNGEVITHSHPYGGTPDQPGHSHTTSQFQTIAQLSHLLTWSCITALLMVLLSAKTIVRNVSGTCRIIRRQVFCHALRAPPFA
ncbi:MAG: hypothetical protein LBR08_11290 [Bacteroidales bacterium]|jgi:hypothetical protein|nr:hypothetical protein [Bacteroidales bacterium]